MSEGQTPDKSSFAFTVCMPTYNRAHIISKAIESLSKQTFRDFELLIIDDGSTDNTEEVVLAWQRRVSFPIVYHWQTNQSMCGAINTGVQLARGELFIKLDSDDEMAPNALERIRFHWGNIPQAQRDQFAGIEGLMQDTKGVVSGGMYPQDVFTSDYLETRQRLGVGGEKSAAMRTDVLRRFPYPRFEGEKYVRYDLVLEEISECYKFLYVNEVFEIFEYQPDGMTRNIQRVRSLNPQGFRHYYRENIVRRAKYYTAQKLFSYYAKYIRFSLLCGVGLALQWKEVPSKLYWLAALPLALIKWPRDRYRRRYYVSKA